MSQGLQRGSLVWGDLEPVRGHEQNGRRPVLVVSEPRFNRSSGTVIAFITTSREPRAPFPFSVELESRYGDGFKTTWVKTTQIRTLAVERLGGLLGVVPAGEVDRCFKAFARICGFPFMGE